MQLIVGTAPVRLSSSEAADSFSPGQIVVVQNLGPGTLHFDFADDVTATSGLRLGPDGVYEFPRTGDGVSAWVVSTEADTDVRVMVVD